MTLDQLHRIGARLRAARAVSCLAVVLASLGAQAFQANGTPADAPVEPASGRIVSPTYIEKSSNDPLTQKEQGWQLSGLNTQFRSAFGEKSTLDFSGGLFYSRELAPRQLFDAGRAAQGFGLTAPAPAEASGLAQSLLTGNRFAGGKSDQALFQRVNYQGNGFNFSGNYSNIGEDFQGFSDLTKQLSATDAKMLGLGMSQMGYAVDYTGVKGLKLATSRSTVETSLTGHKENGLTRTRQSNGLALALGARQNVEYTIAELTEAWDPSVVARETKQSETHTLKWSGEFGKKSQFSLGQTTLNTQVGEHTTEDIRQHALSFKWNEWSNFGFSGGYVSKDNNLTRETNNVLMLNMDAALSPRVKLTGKMVENTIERADATQVENDLLDLRLAATLARNLQLTTGYKHTETTAAGEATALEHQVKWQPAQNWTVVSRLVTTEHSVNDDSILQEHTVSGQIGAKGRPEQLTVFTRKEVLSSTVEQDRSEVVYTRPLGAGAAPAKLLLQAGSYQRSGVSEALSDELVAVQVLNLRPTTRTTASLGYYDGPLLGAGYLTYRTWGQKNANNLGVWGAKDFTPYREIGGEVTHALTSATKLSLKQMEGELVGVGRQTLEEIGIEQQFGKSSLQGRQTWTETPGKDGAPIAREALLWKLTVPSAQPLPEWAAKSMRFTVFQDATTWGFGVLPTWIPVAKPAGGLLLEKRESPDVAGKPVDQYTVQFAGMLQQNLCLQLSHQDNPLVAGQTIADPVRRRYLHLAYALQPKTQLFGRFIDEDRKDTVMEQRTLSWGIIGEISPIERLQFQFDGITRAVGGNSLSGGAYQLEYERTVSRDNALLVKLRLNPRELVAANERVKAEASYRLIF